MLNSFKNNAKGISLMLISALCACFGQLFWKLSASSNSIFFILLGFFLYGIGGIIMIIAYRYGSLSVLQPLLSINYALTIIIGFFILEEPVTLAKVIAVIIIMVGVIFIAGGDE